MALEDGERHITIDKAFYAATFVLWTLLCAASGLMISNLNTLTEKVGNISMSQAIIQTQFVDQKVRLDGIEERLRLIERPYRGK